MSPVAEADLPRLLGVFHSNPQYLEWTEGSEYDLDRLRADWESARDGEGRNMLALRERETGQVVGVIEYMDLNPNDGHPWIGLIMVGADRQREGFAAEAMQAVCAHVNLNWASPVRLAVIDENEAGIGLASSLGFEQYGETYQDLGGGERRLVLLQLRF
jgi:RimJ/RimL family protein N-acetyltransferase